MPEIRWQFHIKIADMSKMPAMNSIVSNVIHEVRLALRTMVKRPSFIFAAVLMLGLGTGVNAALFGIIQSVIFRPLPAKQPEGLVTLSQKASSGVSIPDLEDLRTQNHFFTQIEGYLLTAFSFRENSGTELVTGAEVTSGYLAMLGVEPLLGTVFSSEQQESGPDHSVILSEGFWRTRFGGDSRVVGRVVDLNGEPYTVRGVMPQSLRLPDDTTEIWVPVPANSPWNKSRGIHALRMLARLKPAATITDGQADLQLLTARLAQLYPKEDGGRSVILIGLQEAIVSYIRPKLYLLVVAVIFIFLVSIANVASLSLARASNRVRDIAIRKSLGATRSRLVFELAIENLVVAGLGCALGWLLAQGAVDILIVLKPLRLPRLHEIRMDESVFIVLTVFTFVIAALLTLVHILQFDRLNLNEALAGGGRAAIGSQRQWLRNSLVGAEVATALMLLVGAGLLIRSFQKIYLIDLGFAPQNRMTVHLSLPVQMRTAHSMAELYESICENIRSLPGVSAVGFANLLPLQGSFDTEYFIENRSANNSHDSAEARIVDEDYFQAVGTVLVSGRSFSREDNENAVRVVIVNQKLAKQWFANENPIGHRLRALGNQEWRSIIGVIADMRDSTLESESPAEMFLPYKQNPYPPALWNIGLVVRTMAKTSQSVPTLKRAIQSINPDITVSRFRTMDEVIGDSLRDRHLAMNLLAIFACLSLLLATYGIYALLAYSVRQRTREIGVRMAMGADRWEILRYIVSHGMRVVAAGLLIGTAGAYILGGTLAGLLFGVKTTDPMTFLLANVLLMVIAVCAMLLPAWRGASLHPVDALRFE